MKSKTLIALSASLAAIGCATGGLVGSGDNRAIAPQVAQQAAQQHPEVVAEFGGALGGNAGSYVSSVGNRVGAQSGITSGYNFTALNSPVMNAFAVPGGYIYVTRQLLGLMDDEAELAFVLGHEVGHIAADHSQGRQSRSTLSQIGALLLGVVTGSSTVAQLAGTVAQGYLNTYSQGQEFEADQLGIRYIAQAGYDTNRAAAILGSLGAWTNLEAQLAGRQDDQRATPSWARTHPLSEDRVRRAQQVAQQAGAGAGVVNRDQHLAAISGMIFDDDPAQGVVEGREFMHPDLRFAFTTPAGYGIQNGTHAVSVVGQAGQAQFSTGSYNGDLASYVAGVFQALGGQQGQVSYSRPQATTINGIPAAVSTARVQAQQGVLDVTVVAYQFSSNQAYHFVLITPAGSGIGPFQSMVQSVRRLSAEQAAAIRPRVIQIHTVRSGDTLQSLASRMAYRDYQMERFLALNSLASNAPLRPGDRVKIVVYGNRRS